MNRAESERTLDLLRRVTEATAYSYEAGEYPDSLPDDVEVFIRGDGGLLNALREARLATEAVLRMLPVVEAAVQFRDDVGDLVYPGDPFIAAVDAYRAALAGGSPAEPAVVTHAYEPPLPGWCVNSRAPQCGAEVGGLWGYCRRTADDPIHAVPSAAPAPAADETADAGVLGCPARDARFGRCELAAGHIGPHAADDGDSRWAQRRQRAGDDTGGAG